MLIWELAFEKFPYEDISGTNQIIEYVLSGNREKTIFGPTTPENQKPQQGLKEIITAGKYFYVTLKIHNYCNYITKIKFHH